MKTKLILSLLFIPIFSYSQEEDYTKTESYKAHKREVARKMAEDKAKVDGAIKAMDAALQAEKERLMAQERARSAQAAIDHLLAQQARQQEVARQYEAQRQANAQAWLNQLAAERIQHEQAQQAQQMQIQQQEHERAMMERSIEAEQQAIQQQYRLHYGR